MASKVSFIFPEFQAAFDEAFDPALMTEDERAMWEAHFGEGQRGFVAQAHLILEARLTQLLRSDGCSSTELKKKLTNYNKRIDEARDRELISSSLANAIKSFYKIRNRVQHELHYRITIEDVNTIIRTAAEAHPVIEDAYEMHDPFERFRHTAHFLLDALTSETVSNDLYTSD